MTPPTIDRAAARSLRALAVEIDAVAARHKLSQAEVLRAVIEGLEEQIAEDTAILAMARQLEADERVQAGTALETAIEIVARGAGQRPWRGK